MAAGLLDPGVHREFMQMKEEIMHGRSRIKVLQEEVDTLKYHPDAQQGRALGAGNGPRLALGLSPGGCGSGLRPGG